MADSELRIIITAVNNAKAAIDQSIAQFNGLVRRASELRETFLQGIAPESSLNQLTTAGERANTLSEQLTLLSQKLSQVSEQSGQLQLFSDTGQGLTELQQLDQTILTIQKHVQELETDKGRLDLATPEELQELAAIKAALDRITQQVTILKERSRQGLLSPQDAVYLRGLQTQLGQLGSQFLSLKSQGAGVTVPKIDPAPLQKTGQEVRNLNSLFRDSAAASDLLRTGLNNLSQAASFLAGGFLAVTGIGFVKSLADVAARTEVLETVLVQVARNAGISREAIKKVDDQVQSLGITAQSSRQSLAQFIQAGLDIGKAGELARASQDLAVVSGQNSSEAFQRVLVNIQQLDTVGLRHLGINVQREQAERKFAESLGKTAESLSNTEKRQALLNEVLVESEKLSGLYSESMNNVGKQLTSLPRLHQTLAESVGKNLLPVYSTLVREYTLFLDQLIVGVQTQNAATQSSNTLAKTVADLLKNFRGLASVVVEFRTELTLLASVFGSLVLVSTVMRGIGFVMAGLSPITAAITKQFAGIAESVAKVAPSVSTGMTRVFTVLTRFSTVAPIIGLVVLEFSNLVKIISALASVISSAGTTILDFFKNIGKAISETGTATKATFISLMAIVGIGLGPWAVKAAAGLGVLLGRLLLFLGPARLLYLALFELTRIGVKVTGALLPNKVDLGKDLAKGVTDAQEKVTDLQNQIADLQSQGLTGEAKLLEQTELKAAKETLKARQEYLKTWQDSRKPPAQLAQEKAQEEFKLKLLKGIEANEKFDAALKNTFGDQYKLNVDTGALESTAGVAAISDMETVVKRFLEEIETKSVTATVGFTKIRETIVAAFGKQQTVADLESFSRKLNDLGVDSENLRVSLSELSSTRSFKAQEESLSKLTQEMQGFKAASDQLINIQQTLNEIISTSADTQIAKERVLATVFENRATLSALELRSTAVKANAAIQQYDQETKASEAFYARQKQLAQSSLQDQTALNSALLGIDRKVNEDRLKNGRALYQALQQAAQQYLSQYQQQLERVRALDQQIKSSQTSTINEARDLRRQSLTEEEAYADKQKELADQVAAAKSAASSGDEEAFKAAIARAKQLNSDLSRGGAGVDPKRAAEEAAQQLEALGDLEKAFLVTQKTIAQQAADNAKAAFEDVTTRIEKVKADLANTSLQLLGNIQVNVDQTQLQEQVKLVQSAFDNIVAKVKVETEGNLNVVGAPQVIPQEMTDAVVRGLEPLKVDVGQILQRLDVTVKFWQEAANNIQGAVLSRAEGGGVPGVSHTGKEDNVLAWLTPEEFVQPVRAVRHYGAAFMESIRTLRFPKFWAGGGVSAKEKIRDSASAVTSVISSIKEMPKLWQGGQVSSRLNSYISNVMDSVNTTIAPRSYAFGGTVLANASGPTVEGEHHKVTISSGGKKIGTVRGDRESIRGLVNTLKELGRGT